MFGIGGGELIIILIIAFIFIGPDKFPEIAKSFGKSMRSFKETGHEIKKTIYEEVNKSDLDNLTIITDLQKDFKKITKSINNPMDEIKKATYEMNPINDMKKTIKNINLEKDIKKVTEDIELNKEV